jgi:hypothetical protein
MFSLYEEIFMKCHCKQRGTVKPATAVDSVLTTKSSIDTSDSARADLSVDDPDPKKAKASIDGLFPHNDRP